MSVAAFGDEPLPDYELSRLPVSERPRPGFDPLGHRLGPIFFYPKLTAGLRFDSNVYATPTAARSDWALVLLPELTIQYGKPVPGYGKRPQPFSYEFNLGADIYRFREFGNQNRTDAWAKFRSHWDISHEWQFDTSLEAARRHLKPGDPSAPVNAASPIPYNDLRASATLTRTLGRVGVALNGAVRNLSYGNVESFGGDVLDQSARDGTIYSTYIKPFYEFSPDYRGFVRLSANSRNYAGTGTLNRDSSGYDIRAGLDFAVTPLVFGSVEAGWLSQSYDNPLIRPLEGFVFKGEATWLMTTLMTAKFAAGRRIGETVSPDYTSRVETAYEAQLDYEALRNLIVSAGAKYSRDDFQGGLPRQDDVTKYSFGLDYFMNRHLRLGARYDFISRDSTVPIYTYDKHVVMFNVTAQY